MLQKVEPKSGAILELDNKLRTDYGSNYKGLYLVSKEPGLLVNLQDKLFVITKDWHKRIFSVVLAVPLIGEFYANYESDWMRIHKKGEKDETT